MLEPAHVVAHHVVGMSGQDVPERPGDEAREQRGSADVVGPAAEQRERTEDEHPALRIAARTLEQQPAGRSAEHAESTVVTTTEAVGRQGAVVDGGDRDCPDHHREPVVEIRDAQWRSRAPPGSSDAPPADDTDAVTPSTAATMAALASSGTPQRRMSRSDAPPTATSVMHASRLAAPNRRGKRAAVGASASPMNTPSAGERNGDDRLEGRQGQRWEQSQAARPEGEAERDEDESGRRQRSKAERGARAEEQVERAGAHRWCAALQLLIERIEAASLAIVHVKASRASAGADAPRPRRARGGVRARVPATRG